MDLFDEMDPRYQPQLSRGGGVVLLLVGALSGWVSALLVVLVILPLAGLSVTAGHVLIFASCVVGWIVGGVLSRIVRKVRAK